MLPHAHASAALRTACSRMAWLRARRGVAALEFALVAPVLLSLTLVGIDCARAFLIWREIHNAALAIAENAEKLSLTTDPASGAITSLLTYTQMQEAMSSIFAEIPGLNLGRSGGLFSGNFAVTLSNVVFTPLCGTATVTGCTAQQTSQTPYVSWSTYLDPAASDAGGNLQTGIMRACGPLQTATAFPDDVSQYTTMADPALDAGGNALLTVPPQIVADIQYTFHAYFPLFYPQQVVFYASANVPAPVGGLDQTTGYNSGGNGTSPPAGGITTCTIP